MARPAPELPIRPYDRDDDLLDGLRADGQPRLRISRLEAPAVVLGRGSKPEQELRLAPCRDDGVALLRRRGGGCAVVIDPQSVIVSAALPAAGIGDNTRHFAHITAWLVDGLRRAGVTGVEQAGISDLARGDRKVGGACIYRSRGMLYYSASLLVDPDVALITRYLAHPPREPDYRRGRPHADFIIGLAAFGELRSAVDLEARLRAELDLDQIPAARRPAPAPRR